MNEDQVFFQREEDAVFADPQAIFAGVAGQFLHVALQDGLQGVEFLSDATAQVGWRGPQLFQRFLTDLEALTHNLPLIMPLPQFDTSGKMS